MKITPIDKDKPVYQFTGNDAAMGALFQVVTDANDPDIVAWSITNSFAWRGTPDAFDANFSQIQAF